MATKRLTCVSMTGVIVMLLASANRAADFVSLAPYYDEAEAIEAGQRVGIGSATLEGPQTVEVMTRQTWTLVYTVGKAGIAPGGGIRVGMRHVVQWTPPQTEDPKGIGYFTARTTPDVPTNVHIEYGGLNRRLTWRYFPWQNMVEVTLPTAGLTEGDTIRLTYGDTTGGSPGIRIQPFDESAFTFKVYVDPFGRDDYFPMSDSPTIEIVAADPSRLGVVMPSDAVVGKPTWCIVRAEDLYGNPANRYRGTIRFSATDNDAKLPPDYTFTEADRGVRRFDNIVFDSAGDFTISVDDGTFKRTGNPVRVAKRRPERLLLWGDIHGHTLNSDGRGTVIEFYEFGEHVGGLDFCAVSDHGFEMTDDMWEHSKKVTNAVNKPGRFVTFQAYEWSGNSEVGGDHNVYFLDDDPPIYRSRSYYEYQNLQMYHGPEPQANHIEDLFTILVPMLKNKNVFCIPHWGGRQGNPKWHNPKVQRMIEVFSEHRRSEDWVATFLKNGRRLGIMASTDGHYGNPGYGYLKPTYDWTTQEIGMAGLAVYAPEQTREAIFCALYDRHAYATSGDRIILDVRADGHVMGSEYNTTGPPTVTVQAVGTAPIRLIEIKKDSEVAHSEQPGKISIALQWQDPDFKADRECYYYVRIVQENNEEAISSPIWIN